MELVDRIRERALHEAGDRGLTSCATIGDVIATEECLGFGLHPLYRRLLLDVADGGFGPGMLGVYGVGETGRDPEMPNCRAAWQRLGGADRSVMPAHTVPFADLGCGCWILVDSSSLSGRIRDTHAQGIFELDLGVAELLGAWLSGHNISDLLHDRTRASVRQGINPFTREPLELPLEGPPLGRLILSWPEQA